MQSTNQVLALRSIHPLVRQGFEILEYVGRLREIDVPTVKGIKAIYEKEPGVSATDG